MAVAIAFFTSRDGTDERSVLHESAHHQNLARREVDPCADREVRVPVETVFRGHPSTLSDDRKPRDALA